MTENKRYTWNSKEVVINDNLTGNKFEVVDITEIDVLLDLLNEQDQRIQELANKMNYQAFELYKYGVVSIGKAVELSNMSYHDFIKYCADNGHPVELRL